MTSPPARSMPQAAATCAARTASEAPPLRSPVPPRRLRPSGAASPRAQRSRSSPPRPRSAACFTGLFGVGGGFVIVPALVLALGFEMPIAVGTSLLVIAINAAPPRCSPGSAATATSTGSCCAVFTAAAIARLARRSWRRLPRPSRPAHPRLRDPAHRRRRLHRHPQHPLSGPSGAGRTVAPVSREVAMCPRLPSSTCATRRPGPCGYRDISGVPWPKPSPPGRSRWHDRASSDGAWLSYKVGGRPAVVGTRWG